MTTVFVLIAGTLAAGAALLLVWPLLRRRGDQPAAAVASIVVLLVVLLGGAGLYASFTRYQWSNPVAVADTPAAMTARLAKRLASDGGSVDEWVMLGRSYVELGQTPLALRAFQKADQLANGANAEAVIGMAQALVQQDIEELRGRAGRMFERALEIDPTSRTALFYSAFAALGRNEPGLARSRFSQLLAQEQDPQVRALLEKGIASANAQEAGASAQAPAAAADGPRIMVRVSIAPELAARIPPRDAVLFVAARDPNQPGPPFAVKRLPAHFPVAVELTAADAMMESRRISAGQQLDVVARVALGGTPTATSGDPFGQVSYHVGKDGMLNIVIDRLAP
jgi:cytochrome c-type biogenesis protein CcmH